MMTSALLLTALLLAAAPGREPLIGEAAPVDGAERKLMVKRDDGGSGRGCVEPQSACDSR